MLLMIRWTYSMCIVYVKNILAGRPASFDNKLPITTLTFLAKHIRFKANDLSTSRVVRSSRDGWSPDWPWGSAPAWRAPARASTRGCGGSRGWGYRCSCLQLGKGNVFSSVFIVASLMGCSPQVRFSLSNKNDTNWVFKESVQRV